MSSTSAPTTTTTSTNSSSPHNIPIYIRFKRLNQTLFIECNRNDHLQSIKEKLAELQGKDEDDLQLYEYLSEEKRQEIGLQIIEKQKELLMIR